MEEAASERRKAFAAAHTEVIKVVRLTSFLPDIPRRSRPRPRLRHGRRLALLSLLNLTLNQSILSFVLLLALLRYILPLLTSLTVPLPGSWLRSLPSTWDLTFLSSSQRPCVAEPEATSLSSAEPCVLKSLILLSAPLFLLYFMRLPHTSSHSLLLAQT